MAKGIKKRTINLLPNRNDNILNDFLSWALTVGRLLIIITETLALSVFIYRFALDVKIIDLHDKIKSESTIVENFQEGETLFRNLHARLAFAKDYDSKKDSVLDLLKDVLALAENKITFNTLTVTTKGIDLEAQARSSKTLSIFTQALKNHPEVRNVNINRVENKTSSGLITVGISVELKSSKTQEQSSEQH